MKIGFYYVKKEYVAFLKEYETRHRRFTCVPNVEYAHNDKFVYGAVLNINGICYYVPVSSNKTNKKNNIVIKDKKNLAKGTLRFQYMIPVPQSCLKELIIDELPNEPRKILVSKELAFCRKNRNKIEKQARVTYEAVCKKVSENLTKNSCDFNLLEQAYEEYCEMNDIET